MKEKRTLAVEDLGADEAAALLGANDRNLQIISDAFDTRVSFRDHTFMLDACEHDTLSQIEKVLQALRQISSSGKEVSEQNVRYAIRRIQSHQDVQFSNFETVTVCRTFSGRPIYPKTQGQYDFVKAMAEKPVVFAIGPAGTGKTFLAVSAAVAALKKEEVRRIVLTRPAVEAGESLGFLPGDLKEKVDPYLTPLYDGLHEMLGNEQTERLMEKGTIEIAPLAYMRGRTLNDAFVILDEAQNTTSSQMKMFLTRLGFHSHMVITGDVTQIDLNERVESGLLSARRILSGMDDIAILELSADDVVRHPLVQKIIERYSRFERH
ncbi:PhoH family protein [Lactimicrobium massiliense]|uniref:PhoH family protein n=1 Tax=Lactimicrobium massiliense TaxID=2161814 RepID=UPI001FDA918E|nr:PhoH family protein [Lactimicrobium massiliense]